MNRETEELEQETRGAGEAGRAWGEGRAFLERGWGRDGPRLSAIRVGERVRRGRGGPFGTGGGQGEGLQVFAPSTAHRGGRMELRMSSVCVSPGFCSTGGSAFCGAGGAVPGGRRDKGRQSKKEGAAKRRADGNAEPADAAGLEGPA